MWVRHSGILLIQEKEIKSTNTVYRVENTGTCNEFDTDDRMM